MLLGTLLLTAAALKGHALATGPVAGSGLFASRPLAIGWVEFELAFGVWLLAGLAPVGTWRVTVALFSALAGVSLVKALGGATSCGCFGRLEISPWWTLVLDALAISALVVWRPATASCGSTGGGDGMPTGRVLRFRLAMAAVVLLGVPSAVVMASYRPAVLSGDGIITGGDRLVVLEPEKWVGKPFPLFRYIDIGPQLRHGRWLVVLYHHDCPKCQKAIPRYADMATKWASQQDQRRVALIEVAPHGVPLCGPLYRNCKFGQLADEWQWFVRTPAAITLSSGRVRRVPADQVCAQRHIVHRFRSATTSKRMSR